MKKEVKRKKISFWARKPVTKPVRVKFINKYGELVSFKAKKKVYIPKKVTFYTKPKKKRRYSW